VPDSTLHILVAGCGNVHFQVTLWDFGFLSFPNSPYEIHLSSSYAPAIVFTSYPSRPSQQSKSAPHAHHYPMRIRYVAFVESLGRAINILIRTTTVALWADKYCNLFESILRPTPQLIFDRKDMGCRTGLAVAAFVPDLLLCSINLGIDVRSN
jgi:hypothetical protein